MWTAVKNEALELYRYAAARHGLRENVKNNQNRLDAYIPLVTVLICVLVVYIVLTKLN